jgi:hypothetical protein
MLGVFATLGQGLVVHVMHHFSAYPAIRFPVSLRPGVDVHADWFPETGIHFVSLLIGRNPDRVPRNTFFVIAEIFRQKRLSFVIRQLYRYVGKRVVSLVSPSSHKLRSDRNLKPTPDSVAM